MHGVAFEQRVGKFHFGHAEIGDGGADRQVIDHDADHQAEREQRIHQRLSPFRFLLAEMAVDVERLRIERHVGEQHVVHLRHRPGERMLVEAADLEVVEIDASALVTGCYCSAIGDLPRDVLDISFTIIVNAWQETIEWRGEAPRSARPCH